MSNLLESLSTMVGGRRKRSKRSYSRKHGGSGCGLAEPQSAGKRRGRKHSRRRRCSSKRGGSGMRQLNPETIGGRRKRSRRHKKRGGSQLIPLGFLGAILSLGKGRKSRKGKKTGGRRTKRH